MKGYSLLILICIVCICLSVSVKSQSSFVNKVNPLIGVQHTVNDTLNNNYPIVGLPYGMNFWIPQTTDNQNKIIYSGDSKIISGFQQTHQITSTEVDFGAFSLMPMSDTLITDCKSRAVSFEKYNETFSPYYYKVRLDNGVTTEIAPTERAAIMRFKYAYGGKSYLLLDAIEGKSKVEIIPNKRKIVGYCTNNNGQMPASFANYFVIRFLRQFDDYGTWSKNKITSKQNIAEGDNEGAWLMFNLNSNEVVTVEVASSFISIEQAERNLENELNHKPFETVKQHAMNVWNTELGRITVYGGTEEQQQLFYTSMYRMLLSVRIQYEFDPLDNPVYYSFYDGALHNRHMFSDNVFERDYKYINAFYGLLKPELQQQYNEARNYANSEGRKSIASKIQQNSLIDTANILQKPYWYSCVLKPWDTQTSVRKLLIDYSSTEQIKLTSERAAWYIFSAMGIYPVDTLCILGSPIFNKVTVNLPNKKVFTILADNNSAENMYVKQVKLNEKLDYTRNYFNYSDINNNKANSVLTFVMSNVADTMRGTQLVDSPYLPKIEAKKEEVKKADNTKATSTKSSTIKPTTKKTTTTKPVAGKTKK